MKEARQGDLELHLPTENQRVATAVLRARLAYGGDISKFYDAAFAAENKRADVRKNRIRREPSIRSR